MTRQLLLQKLWGVINGPLDARSLEKIVKRKLDDDVPFSDTGAAIERMLAAGVAEQDVRLVMRHAAYHAVFDTLYWIADPSVAREDLDLYESLLSADPSGMEGRPGSADAVSVRGSGLPKAT